MSAPELVEAQVASSGGGGGDGKREGDGAPAPRRAERVERVLGVSIAAALALAAPISALMPRYARVERGALWGIVVLVSMAGWGDLVARRVSPSRSVDLGLRLAWGAASLVAAGGLLCLLHAARTPVLLALLLGGVAAAVFGVARAPRVAGANVLRWIRRWPSGVLVAFAPLALLALVTYLGGAAGEFLNGNDDQAAYMIFTRKILATGTMIDPFSMRRITAYGGQSFLQALTIVGAASPMQVALLDIGVCLAIVLVLVVGAFDERTPRAQRALAILPPLLLLTMPNIRLNSASEISGVAVFLGLFRTAAWPGFAERPRERGVLLALVGAATATLRHSYLVPVAVFMAALYLPTVLAAVRAPRDERRRLLLDVARVAGLLVLFLLPWAVLAQLSSRTFLFPLLSGNYRVEYGGFTTQSNALDRVKFLWINVCHCHPVTTIAFFLIAAVALPAAITRGALRALFWAGLVGFVGIVWSLPMSHRWDISRYYYGFSVATVLATMTAVFTRAWRRPTGRLRLAVLVPALIAIGATLDQVRETHGAVHGTYNQALDFIVRAGRQPSSLQDEGDRYRAMQEKIPAGAPMLVMLDEAFWFDFSRNRIDIIDLPGAASPPPGMPLDDDDRLASYALEHGYRYLAFVLPTASRALYRRDVWEKQLSNPNDGLEIWRLTAPVYLHTFDRLTGLAKSRLKLYDDGTMVAVDLGARANH
jgi:hypothetical protein